MHFKQVANKLRQNGVSLAATILVMLLTGCSSHTIHLFGDKKDLHEELQSKSGFKVIARSNESAKAFTQNTLISPSDLKQQELQSLIELLKQQGVEIDHIAYGSYRNHSYQNGNIGLYLANDHGSHRLDIPTAEIEQVDFTGQYQSINCQDSWQLELKGNRRWQVTHKGLITNGHWRSKGHTLILLLPDSRIRFDGHPNKKHNNVLQLIPIDHEKLPWRCQYRKQSS
ncbi:hypothetical protein [uncultured Pseudoteredinibacter sp.]|uniref:hypothetical protein n=1 Tax=uncultured Pseudoteredinibacter sp. TaxID=1641701 RepID=UPI00260FDE8F|nr:hypothetical protein [uncultured Pseudoteredinibacter sp.]